MQNCTYTSFPPSPPTRRTTVPSVLLSMCPVLSWWHFRYHSTVFNQTWYGSVLSSCIIMRRSVSSTSGVHQHHRHNHSPADPFQPSWLLLNCENITTRCCYSDIILRGFWPKISKHISWRENTYASGHRHQEQVRSQEVIIFVTFTFWICWNKSSSGSLSASRFLVTSLVMG